MYVLQNMEEPPIILLIRPSNTFASLLQLCILYITPLLHKWANWDTEQVGQVFSKVTLELQPAGEME